MDEELEVMGRGDKRGPGKVWVAVEDDGRIGLGVQTHRFEGMRVIDLTPADARAVADLLRRAAES